MKNIAMSFGNLNSNLVNFYSIYVSPKFLITWKEVTSAEVVCLQTAAISMT